MSARSSFRFLLAVLLLVISIIPATSQNSPVSTAVDAILSSSNELYTHHDITIDWKMKGRAQATFNEGLNDLAEENEQRAITNFNSAIEEDGGFWEVYYYRGIANKNLENFDEAKKDFKLLIDGNKEKYFSQIELGKIAVIQHDLDESDRYYNKAIKATNNNAYALYLKANNYMLRGMDKAAMNSYRECIGKDSTMYDALVRLAMLSSKKNLNNVFPYLNKVLRRDSLNANALLLRGLARTIDNKELAIRDFSNLLIRNPNMLVGRYLRGIVYCDLDDFDRAFTDFQRLVESTASDDNEYTGRQTWTDKKIDIQNLGAYTVSRIYGLPDEQGTALKKAYCLLVSGRAEECVNVIDALSIADSEPLCVYFKAIAMEHTSKHGKAFEYYNRALQLDKDIVDAYKKRGIYYQEMKMWDKSVADFTTVLKYRPKMLIALSARGVSYLKGDHFAEAFSDFDQYLKIDSTNLEVMAYRGLMYVRLNDVLLGSVDYVNADRSDAIDAVKLSQYVDSVLVAGGDTLKVIRSLNTITKKAPWITDVYAHKIKLLINMGKWDQVSSEIDHAVTNRNVNAKASYSYLLTVKGITRSRAKKYDEAIEILSEAIDVDKKNALAFLERGKLHAHAGKSGKAISDLNKAMSLGRKDAGEVLASVKAGQ
ncbi:tetratricopeptide repeat protein [Chryseolinea sp. T2]|uniref:tetratricopeptide repeat protein n=1 Tax=Chryseolinea sp. T2 TaxID=3129255 RepID=UPI003077613C